LLKTKHEVARLEGPSAYPSVVVVAKALLIDCRSGETYISCLIQQIEGIFQCHLCIFFNIGYYARCAVPHIHRKHCLCTEEQEEQHVTGG
jgi:hypothetical protein